MRIGLRIPPSSRADVVAASAARAEELGFDGVWFPDSQLLWRDVFTTMTAVALATRRIRIGTAVTNVVTRDVSVLAAAVNGVHELCPGRFALGVGIGDSAVRTIGRSPASGGALREGIDAVRRLLDGGENPGGFRLRDAAGRCPVLVAATGPRNLALAGEIGDGVILLGGADPAGLRASLESVEIGLGRAGAALRDREVVVATYCAVTDDVERDAIALKPMCMTIAQHGGGAALRRMGVEVQAPSQPAWVYPDLVHAEDWDAAVAVSSRWITDEMAVRFARRGCLFGSVEEIAAQARALEELGVTELMLHHVGPYTQPTELMEALAPMLAP